MTDLVAHRAPRVIGGTLAAFLIGGAVLIVAVLAGVVGLQPQPSNEFAPSREATRDIPPVYLRLYQAAGATYGVDWSILAAIGKIETDHGRSRAPGVQSGVNSYGCCAGPMQFSIIGDPSTWDSYSEGDGSVYDPAAAIPAAARYLVASGAPGDYQAAIFAYNHAQWYVDEVLAQAEKYRGAASAVGGGPVQNAAALGEILGNHRIVLTAGQRADLQAGGFDARLLSVLAWIGERHAIVITALRADHSPLTSEGNASNHAAGRAADIGMVDGRACQWVYLAPPDDSPCSRLVLALAKLEGPLRPTELIAGFDADGPSDPRSFALPDHTNHIHVGFDG